MNTATPALLKSLPPSPLACLLPAATVRHHFPPPLSATIARQYHPPPLSATILLATTTNRYYGETFTVPGTDKTVEVLLFDSVLGLGNSDENEFEWQQPPGPKDEPTAQKQCALACTLTRPSVYRLPTFPLLIP